MWVVLRASVDSTRTKCSLPMRTHVGTHKHNQGYTERFGIVAVDFDDPALPRAVKRSGRFLSEHFFKVSA